MGKYFCQSVTNRGCAINANFTAPPAELAAQLTRPSASYKNSARLAVAGLLLFVALYFALAGWFLYTPYRVFFHNAGRDLGVLAWVMGLCSLFIGVFMVKAIFSVRNAKPTDLHEVSAKDQPRLFAFLYELADAAGAPRPHKVYLSARVNAAVFYDLSLFNLIFPSKKNLEIGLALVNTVTLGELRAVLAHEFGHFAQRSMAVGRWVYVAQQIATHLVTRRDALDDFLVSVGNLDLRIRAVVAVVQLVIWSIRSLVESLFNAVILMQRALSREMEMQADLVAVSLTGSDALIHALHRLQGADDAWDRALHFIHGEQNNGRATRDAFAVQSHMLQRMSAILNDEAYAKVPPLPAQGQDKHRIFKVELAQPPRMWLTHPLNHEREANAKKVYVPAAIDPASAWSLFEYPNLVREEMTGRLLAEMEGEAKPVELEESLKTLGRQFKREHYNRRYCGIFFGRSLARHAEHFHALRNPQQAAPLEQLSELYPATLTADIATLRTLETEADQIRALIAGHMTAPGKLVQVRGAAYRKKQLPAALERVRGEIEAVTARLLAHDHLCRSWHQQRAAQLGGGWQPYLDGLLALIHYAEHAAANVQDAHGLLNNTTAVATATRKVSEDNISRIIHAANALHYEMERVYQEAARVVPDERLRARLELEGSWQESMGAFGLNLCERGNINQWLGVVDSWVRAVVNTLNALRTAALEELLVTETMVARLARDSEAMTAAPAPSQAPSGYPVLLPGAERKRQTTLSWWARFQRADGWLAGGARVLAAGAIVAAVLGASSFSGNRGTSVFGDEPAMTVYNGLGVPVDVAVDGHKVRVGARASRELVVPTARQHHVEAHTADGRLIEAFEASEDENKHPVYNVAGATPLAEWYATYGSVAEKEPHIIGPVRWLDSGADHVFTEPPKSVSGSKYSSGSYRTVLTGAADATPGAQTELIADPKQRDRVVMLHLRWDPTNTYAMEEWIELASKVPGFDNMLAERLGQTPGDVLLRREQYDRADPARQAELCRETSASAAAKPDDPDLAYLALRCAPDGMMNSAGFRAAAARWPQHGWLANSIAHDQLESPSWADAAPALEQAMRLLPQRAPVLALDLARLKRYQDPQAGLGTLPDVSPSLRQLLALEKGSGPALSADNAFAMVAKGACDAALDYAKGSSDREAYLLRLIAASDGAAPATVARALALPPERGQNAATAWLMLALAVKTGQDTPARRAEALAAGGRYGKQMMAFFDSVHKGVPPAVAERALGSVHPTARAYAYSAALVVAGKRAPPAWRSAVQRLLFASERPYFT